MFSSANRLLDTAREQNAFDRAVAYVPTAFGLPGMARRLLAAIQQREGHVVARCRRVFFGGFSTEHPYAMLVPTILANRQQEETRMQGDCAAAKRERSGMLPTGRLVRLAATP